MLPVRDRPTPSLKTSHELTPRAGRASLMVKKVAFFLAFESFSVFKFDLWNSLVVSSASKYAYQFSKTVAKNLIMVFLI